MRTEVEARMTTVKIRDVRDEDEKRARQKVILEIIGEGKLGTQEELVREVTKRGFSCTQTTISRDLSELRVIKVSGRYRPWAGGAISTIERVLTEMGIGVVSAGPNLVILKTRAGCAQTVAVEFDRAGWKEIAGTLAGDDTIFVAVPGRREADAVLGKLRKILEISAL
jgi:transcriptional regulator of arginine metabolism